MRKLIKKPHYFFFGLVPIFILIAIFKGENAVDINIHATYFVISVKHLCFISAIFFCLIGINYFSLIWMEKPPKKWLTIIHIILQVLSLIPFIYWLFVEASEDLNSNYWNFYQFMIVSLLIAFILFTLSVLIHLTNFLSSIFLKKE